MEVLRDGDTYLASTKSGGVCCICVRCRRPFVRLEPPCRGYSMGYCPNGPNVCPKCQRQEG